MAGEQAPDAGRVDEPHAGEVHLYVSNVVLAKDALHNLFEVIGNAAVQLTDGGDSGPRRGLDVYVDPQEALLSRTLTG
ncbi:hypothetical protein OG992_00455 [Micromonospora sp. NBC_00362]|nr:MULTISPECIES: hypothetical protein [Micromonospora]MCG5449571.1 hypothetical protein [Micromonospora hortensis]MCX5115630.1 hypothetical protein [Micromonospora sp. NBC_00362]WTI06043.1 hypothetical protein OHB44_21710 [Micromonospora sp. NBC_00821]